MTRLRRSYDPPSGCVKRGGSAPAEGTTRRDFLKLLSAGIALGTAAGCSAPPLEQILPYVDMPEELIPGEPLFYASAYVRNGYARGVLVESNMGRATKVEGNPRHPSSLGATDAQTQGAVLDVWDPDRSQAVHGPQGVSTWPALYAALEQVLANSPDGRGLRVLTGTVTSPTLIAQLTALAKRYPQMRWHSYQPLHDDRAAAGAALAFGRPLSAVYRLDRVQTLVTLDARLFSRLPGSVRYARDYADARRRALDAAPVRLYTVESSPSLEGVVADERLALPPHEIERLIWRVAARLGVTQAPYAPQPQLEPWERALAQALTRSRGRSLIVAGPALSPQTHALVHALNRFLGNDGRTVSYIEPVEAHPGSHADSLGALVREMGAGEVQALVMLGGNPVYDTPAHANFGAVLGRVPFTLHHALFRDETSRRATWHAPLAHDFESWSDARAHDGTASIVQPVMRPLYAARSWHELLAWMNGEGVRAGYDIVRAHWREQGARTDFESWWTGCLRTGVIGGTAAKTVNATAKAPPHPPRLQEAGLSVIYVEDESVETGQYGNNAWLQEIPRPLTKITWGNALVAGPGTARELGIRTSDVVALTLGGRTLELPVWVLPGQADGVLVLSTGYGRWAAGRTGTNLGYNAYALMTGGDAPPRIEKTGRQHVFATTQNHGEMHGRDIVRSARWEEYRRNPRFASDEKSERRPEHTLYPEYVYDSYKWGMVIDLNACIGCNACTIACQAENNIPVVGPVEVNNGREMHWIRIDRYYEGDEARPRTHFQPVPCMHCEKAPCEEVCPVGATMHDTEGLNVQVYNRCIGTRFCSNNCPYKVRRFNFLQYSEDEIESLKGVQNPEVTVRHRGVMEKCTYCLQRITRGRIEAQKAGRRIRDGEVRTACQSVCPTNAIAFGDLNDPDSAVSRARRSPLDYGLLAELNTQPRTTYLARVLNPDPDLDE